jgi:hypothetical protein
VWAANAAPLGFELGVATLSQVQQGLSAKTRLTDTGTNKYTGGKMLSGTGAGLDVDGLKEITFIFDQNNVLAGVTMSLNKGDGMHNEGFKKLSKTLASKYKQVEKREPFVGDCYARYVQGDSVVILNVPHMGFDMGLSYLTKGLLADFNKQSVQEKSAQQKTQASKF